MPSLAATFVIAVVAETLGSIIANLATGGQLTAFRTGANTRLVGAALGAERPTVRDLYRRGMGR